MKFWMWVVRGLLRLRYRVEVVGLENVVSGHSKGTLYCPNHQAFIDPLIINAYLTPKVHLRPVVAGSMYNVRVLKPFFKIADAIVAPDMRKLLGSEVRKVKTLQSEVREALDRGENILVYPSGTRTKQSKEIIGGASLVHELVSQRKESPVVLVRIQGLWGSVFSNAWTGKPMSWKVVVGTTMKALFQNGIFFAPRRDVKVTVEAMPESIRELPDRQAFNTALEEWYNQYPGPADELKLISYSRWRNDVPTLAEKKSTSGETSINLSTETIEYVKQVVAEQAKKSSKEISVTTHFSRDLSLDSLDIAMMLAKLEEVANLDATDGALLGTVEDLLKALARAQDRDKGTSHPTIPQIPQSSMKSLFERVIVASKEESVIAAFLAKADELKSEFCCIDRMRGPLTYFEVKRAALILSEKLKKLDPESKYIGVMLPSSSAALITILAVYFAGKIPVMINWTAGQKTIASIREMKKFRFVLTSKLLTEKILTDNLGAIEDALFFLEDFRKKISFWDKLFGQFLAMKSAPSLMKKMKRLQFSDVAVVLFTSGTEDHPKEVPLTHGNLLSNIEGVIELVKLKPEIVHASLPPFHAFGFNLTTLLPPIVGLPVCFSPDPKASYRIVREIVQWKVTMIISVPSFLEGIYEAGRAQDLTSLRLIFSGAEKAKRRLKELVQQKTPKVWMQEGYGTTECSPVISVNISKEESSSVGKVLPNLEVRIVEMEGENGEGEIVVSGPSIFSGYLNSTLSPFIQMEGKKWYRTGDKGYLDMKGEIVISGRLKRFVKIGGEMVSLTAVETKAQDLLIKKYGEDVKIAILGSEEDGKGRMVAFTNSDARIEDLNAALQQDLGSIARISEMIKIQEIPTTALGKPNYPALKGYWEKKKGG